MSDEDLLTRLETAYWEYHNVSIQNAHKYADDEVRRKERAAFELGMLAQVKIAYLSLGKAVPEWVEV